MVIGKLWATSLCNPVVPHKKWDVDATGDRHLEEGGWGSEDKQDRLRHKRSRVTQVDPKLTPDHPNGSGWSLSMENQWVGPAELVQRASGN